ncbi:MAG: NAD-dependent epimerase/dehydratase family protein [Verrucomicrobiota bacterium]
MRILITGGAGFVGSNLALTLKQNLAGVSIVCMDNLYRRGSELNVPRLQAAGIEFFKGDVRDPQGFPTGPFDFLIECSAEPSVLAGLEGSPDYLMHTNLNGAYHCLEKARQWNSGFLFLSTSRVYPMDRLQSHAWQEGATRFEWLDAGVPGISSQGVSEAVDMSGARSLYGFTKYAAELLIEEYRASFNLRTVINRCGVIAGPWQFGKVDQGILSLWVMAHHYGRPLSYIGFGGAGKQVRDFLHVQDLCELILDQIQNFDRWDGWLGNVAGGRDHSASLLELTALCQEIIGRQVPITSNPVTRPADLRLFIGDCQRLFARTPWRPRRNIRQNVSDIAAWVRANEAPLQKL